MTNTDYLLMVAIPIALVSVIIYAIRSDKKTAHKIGKRVRNLLPDGWRLMEGGLRQGEFPFEKHLPSESLSVLLQAPVLVNDVDGYAGDTWIFGNCTVRTGARSVIGNSVMVALKLEQSPGLGIRIQRKAGGRLFESVEDDRFETLETQKQSERHWYLCATENSEAARALIDAILSNGIPKHVYLVQLLGDYLITSNATMHFNPNNYLNALANAQAFRDLIDVSK